MKKILIIIGTIFILTLAAAWLWRRPKPTIRPSVPARPQQAAPPPVAESIPGAPKNVKFNYQFSVKVPTELPVYEARFSYDPTNLVIAFANRLNLGNPTITTDKFGEQSYSWNNPEQRLVHTKTADYRSLSYQRLTPGPGNLSLSPDAVGRDFLKNSLKLPEVDRLRLLGQEQQAAPKITNLQYATVINNYPLLLANHDPVSVNVGVDAAGAVRLATIVFPPDSLSPQETKPALSAEAALSSLNNNLGLLLWSFETPGATYGVAPEFDSVIIRGLTVAYHFDSQQNSLLPVYLFDGLGLSGDKQQTVRYLLMATN